MVINIEIEIRIEKDIKQPKVVIIAPALTEDISNLAKSLSRQNTKTLVGFINDELRIINPNEIVRICAQGQKVFATINNETLLLKYRIYELESFFQNSKILRVSNSEIVNFGKVKSLDISMAGTIGLTLHNGEKAYVSRRYIGAIRKFIGI